LQEGFLIHFILLKMWLSFSGSL